MSIFYRDQTHVIYIYIRNFGVAMATVGLKVNLSLIVSSLNVNYSTLNFAFWFSILIQVSLKLKFVYVLSHANIVSVIKF
jgi:hypothetical protein